MANNVKFDGEFSKSDNEIIVVNKIHRTPPKSQHNSRKASTTNDKTSTSNPGKPKDRDRSASVKRKRDPIETFCGACKQEFGRGIKNCVECDLCSRWFHYLCVNLTADELSAITLLGDKICWYCPSCSIGASSLHKQTKLLNDKISKVDSEVNALKVAQTATTEEIVAMKENAATNVSNISRNTTRITSAKEDIAKLSVVQQANTTKITTIGSRIDSIHKNLKEDIQKELDERVSDAAILEIIQKKVDENLLPVLNEDGTIITKNSTDNIEKIVENTLNNDKSAVIKKIVEDKVEQLYQAAQPNAKTHDEIKKVVENKVEQLYKADFPSIPEQMDTGSNAGNDLAASKVYYPTRLSKAVQEEISEREEIQKRKNQLLILNLKESKSENEDRQKLKDLFGLLKLNQEVNIKEAIRLGEKRRDNKQRFLKVTLEDLSVKREILAKATSLRNVPDDSDYAKVYIKPNLTVKQNEQSKNLQEELRARRLAEPTKKLKISKGRIIEVTNNQQ